MTYTPQLPTYVWAAYASENQWVVLKNDPPYIVDQVKKVERPEKDTEKTNGIGPCILYFYGQPKPLYFKSGHEHLNILVLDTRSGD